MRSVVALAVLAFSVAASSPAKAPPAKQVPADRFSVVLDYTATGWSAKCETGCSYTASFSCATACGARVDGRGIVTLAEGRPYDSLFAFIVERTSDGVRAQSRIGTAWASLSWGCASQTCRARVTDSGVFVLGTSR
jgi:hypothetical protein